MKEEKCESGPTVAMLRLPISIGCMSKLRDVLSDVYGKGLTVREDPKGWLDIRQPNQCNETRK